MSTKDRVEKRTETSSGIEMKTFFGPSDTDLDYDQEVADPGKFPYTRGPYETMYRGKLWTMRQYAGYASAVESNSLYRYLPGQSQFPLSIVFRPSQRMGDPAD